MAEQIFGAVELDEELAGLEVDAGGKVGERAIRHVGRCSNQHSVAGKKLFLALDFGNEFGSARELPVMSPRKPLEPAQDLAAFHQKSAAGLIAAEGVHELDGAAALDAEDFFHRGAVDDRDIEGFQQLLNSWKLQNPGRLGGHFEKTPYALCYCTDVHKTIATQTHLMHNKGRYQVLNRGGGEVRILSVKYAQKRGREVANELVPVEQPKAPAAFLPGIIARAGQAAVFASEEFFFGRLRNPHTRAAYLHAVEKFLAWAEGRGLELINIAPKDVGQYFDGLREQNSSIATRKQHLAALRHFFDGLVTRHAIILNPALSVRGDRYQVVEGKTPEITVDNARTLLLSIKTSSLIGLRDRALIAVLIYTAARAGAVAALRCGHFYDAGDQFVLHFEEKGGKSREIPVRHDLERFLLEYMEAAKLTQAPKDAPLFRTALRKTGKLTKNAMNGLDVGKMMKRRLRDASLPLRLSPHSFRVTTITDLLEQGVPLEDVQRLAGHADPRTTRLYDRRQQKITRNVVERISI